MLIPADDREKAMAQFYLVNYEQYTEAANQFFTDNPGTLTEENAIWAAEHYVELHRDELLKRFLQSPTEE